MFRALSNTSHNIHFYTHIDDVVHALRAGRVSDGDGAEHRGLEALLSLAGPALDGNLLRAAELRQCIADKYTRSVIACYI